MNEATSSPIDSPPSDVPRYFGDSEYDDRKYSYSSPPSSVPSSGNSSFGHASFQPFPEYCQDAIYTYSSPLAHNMHQGYHLPPPPAPAVQQQLPPTYGEYTMQMPQTAPRAAMIPGLAINRPAPEIHPDLLDRPEPKRRKTCPEIYTTTSSPTKSIRKDAKRGAGKDGEDVWPTEVEVAFFESIRLVPKLGRKKIVVNGKPCGRNELIGDYIRRKTGVLRSRKQVSSHIQVLKNIRRGDTEFTELVAEPKAGEAEEDFTPEAHRLFFLPQEFAHVQPEPHQPPPPPPRAPNFGALAAPAFHDGLLSPYCGGSFFSQTSSSGPSSPALSACSGRSLSPYGNMARTPSTESLPQQVYQMKLASPLASPYPQTVQGEHVIYQHEPTAASTSQAYCVPALPPPPQITSINVDATPKASPSKLGHRRAASRGLSLHIPPNNFGQQQQQQQQQQLQQNRLAPAAAMQDGQLNESYQAQSNPSTPWPQMLHTPTCPPPAPSMLPSPSQKNRLTAIWAESSEDWNKASPALEKSFDYERELSAAVISSQNMQKAAARGSVPLKRSFTDVPLSSSNDFLSGESNQNELKHEDDQFFTSLLGSREF